MAARLAIVVAIFCVIAAIGISVAYAVSGYVPPPGAANFDATGTIPCCSGPDDDRGIPTYLTYDPRTHSIVFFDARHKKIERLARDGSIEALAGSCLRELVWGTCVERPVDGRADAAMIGGTNSTIVAEGARQLWIWDGGLRYLSDSGVVKTVNRWDGSGDCMSLPPTNAPPAATLHARPCYITSIAFDPHDRQTYVVDYYQLRRTEPDGRLTTVYLPHVTGEYHGMEHQSQGVAFDPHGSDYVLFSDRAIVLVPQDGKARLLAGCSDTRKIDVYGNVFCGGEYRDGRGDEAMFDSIKSLTYDPDDGALYVVDGNIRRVTMDGDVTTLVGKCGIANTYFVCSNKTRDGPASVANPGAGLWGIVFNPDDHDLYVSDTVGHAIRRITRAGRVSTVAELPIDHAPFPEQWSAEFAADGGYRIELWVDGRRETERFFWHGVLYDERFGFADLPYFVGSRVFDVPYGFYRVGREKDAAPPFHVRSDAPCGTWHENRLVNGLQYEWSESRWCLSLRALDRSGQTVYSEIERLWVPHAPPRRPYGKQ